MTTKPLRIFLSVGEPSGDLHAANLIRQLRSQQPQIECVGFGGPQMAAAGCHLLADMSGLAVMLLAALWHIRKFLRLLRRADEYFAAETVDAVILIDFPGFNWWVARKAKARGIPVFYYGVPQMWAWAPWRVRKLRRWVDLVICKLPFEPGWFAARGVSAHFVGHPFYDQLDQQSYDETFIAELRRQTGLRLLLLPGSRQQEVQAHWPILRKVATRLLAKYPQLKVCVGCYRKSQFDLISADIQNRGLAISAHFQRTPELMKAADLCLACSGSVSLELMYHRLPTVILYQLTWLLGVIRWLVLRCRYITLVNLMAAERIENPTRQVYDPDRPGAEPVPMPEYLLRGDRVEDLVRRLSTWIEQDSARTAQANWLGELKSRFANPGASERAAALILNRLQRDQNPLQRAA